MRATEIIRNLLCLIDQIDTDQPVTPTTTIEIRPAEHEPAPQSEPEKIVTGIDSNRFKHIIAMIDAERSTPTMYDNTPVEVTAGVDSVTKDAGGGWNGPKNPADLRAANSFSMFPAYQAEKK